jgi:Acetyltransferase (GNAT) domain
VHSEGRPAVRRYRIGRPLEGRRLSRDRPSAEGSSGVLVTDATMAQWAAAFVASPEATFFHSPMWSRAWELYTGGGISPAPKRVAFPDGRTAIVAASRQRLGVGCSRYLLSPDGTYGGWVSEDRLAPEHERQLVQAIIDLGSVIWRQAPWARAPVPAGRVTMDVTHLIDLSRGAEAARAAWKDGAKRRVRRAARAGVAVREAVGDDDWRAYDELYRISLARWGTRASSAYEPEFFTALRARGREDVRLWLAEVGGRFAAGALVLTTGRHAAYWHGASDPTLAPGAANLLLWEIIGALAGEGFATFDLNPSAGMAGVMRFKQSLGATAAPAPLCVKRSPIEALARTALPRQLRQRLRKRFAEGTGGRADDRWASGS